MQTRDPLALHPFLQDLSLTYQHLLVACATTVHFQAGEFVFHAGEEATQVYLIQDGRVAVQVFFPGSGPRTIATVEAEHVLGWSWLFPPYRWHFDAQAVEPTQAMTIDGSCLRTVCDRHHDLGYILMQRCVQIMSQRLAAARQQLVELVQAL